VDEILNSDFLEKQRKKLATISKEELAEIYEFGSQLLQQDFKIIEPKKETQIPKIQKETAEQIIDYLNEKTGKMFTKKMVNLKPIVSRINDGYVFEDFKFVIEKKCHDWLGTNFQEYLRPNTLFGNKFETYINLKNDKPVKTNFDQLALAVANAKTISFRRK
jgi:uncharacterized phage protein (TIGR02220 family)